MSTTDATSLMGGGGAGSGAVAQLRFMPESGQFVCQYPGTLSILAMAAHGSGAVAYGSGPATGPGAGEVAIKEVSVQAGDTFTVSIGSGGAAVTRSAAGFTQGNDGGDTTVTGPYSTAITVKGGKAGAAGAAGPLLGGAGGTGGSGGDVHMPGGRGGNVVSGISAQVATGSGAPNMLNLTAQTATRGGDITWTSVSGSAMTGAGGVGGRGGDITSAGTSTAGGGYGGNGTDNVNASAATAGRNGLGQRVPASPSELSGFLAHWGLNIFGGGGYGGTAPGAGGGSGGNSGAVSQPPGACGGVAGSYLGGAGSAPSGVRGPGGSVCAGSGTVNSGAGDNGFVAFILRKG